MRPPSAILAKKARKVVTTADIGAMILKIDQQVSRFEAKRIKLIEREKSCKT